MKLKTCVVNQTDALPARPDRLLQQEAHPASETADILFEQLDDLIQFADREHERLDRVKAVLMEPFL